MVEILVALAVLILGVSGVYYQFCNTDLRARQRLNTIQARWLAHQEYEQLRACAYEDLKNWASETEARHMPTHLKFNYRRVVESRSDGLLELTVQVGWEIPKAGGIDPANSVTIKGLKGP